ncbi:M14 family zinc carboxypeptidase [Aurantibacter sp.]|uniref:M14 family zinc carboxypeptidase n=1 Tax=Aurantibacter sp. TaxID=2807103 RepID=UPI0032655276
MINKINYKQIKVSSVSGRYITNESIDDFLSNLNESFIVETIGKSVQQRPIKSVTVGNGSRRIFMWSQMHGNESTTTKAVLDVLNFLSTNQQDSRDLLNNCTLKIIPILSPDGAAAYTRVNANQVDLNRDAQDLTQPESIVLHETFKSFNPHFAFNLHGQRTFYNVGETDKSATVSFLSPSVDAERNITTPRKIAMQLIVAMNKILQKDIPDGVGRYDDGFNLNCVGDTFQSLNCPTILFEAGHFQNDYDREVVRQFIFNSLITSIATISTDTISAYNYEDYFNIPENGKQFYDIIIKNAHLFKATIKAKDAVALQFVECLEENKVLFNPKIEKIGELTEYYGHKVYDCAIESQLSELKGQRELCKILNNNL